MGALKTRLRILLTRIFGKDFSNPSLTKLIKNTTVVSFDVFDTLIVRPGLKTPSDLFALLHPEDSTFKPRRIEAERKARKQSSLEDITLSDIYKLLYAEECERQEAVQLEISTELSVCKANPEALEFFNTVRKDGKRVVITSDMYLDRSTIENILTNNGFDLEGVNVCVSSEYGKTKRTSNLFKTVMREEGMEGREGEVLHIGDHYISDYLNPRKVGMKSFLYNR